MEKTPDLERWRARLPWLGIAVLGLVQLWALPGDYIGMEHDDAHYVLAANALLRGEYRLGVSPGNPPLAFIPPGLPLLLVPAAAVGGLNPAPFHLTAWLFLLACDALIWVWLRRRLRPVMAFWATAFFALNPLVLARAGKVMTEIPALAFLLALCAAMDCDRWPPWASGAVMGFLWLVRQRATALFAAVWAWYCIRGRWKDAVASAAVPLCVCLAWSWWLAKAGSGMPELAEWAVAYGGWPDAFSAAGANAAYYLGLWGRLWLPFFPAPPAVEWACGIFFAGLSLRGLWSILRRRGLEPGLGWLLFGGLMHLAWPWRYERYLAPFLPMLLWGLMESADRLGSRRRGLLHAALGLILAGQFWGQGLAVLSGRCAKPSPELAQTYAWIRGNVPSGIALASHFFSRDAIYAGRPFAPLPAADDPEKLARDLRRERVGYVLVEDGPDLGFSLGSSAAPVQALERQRRSLAGPGFKEAYRNARERSAIYEVLR